jgi:hypothetical protein
MIASPTSWIVTGDAGSQVGSDWSEQGLTAETRKMLGVDFDP